MYSLYMNIPIKILMYVKFEKYSRRKDFFSKDATVDVAFIRHLYVPLTSEETFNSL